MEVKKRDKARQQFIHYKTELSAKLCSKTLIEILKGKIKVITNMFFYNFLNSEKRTN